METSRSSSSSAAKDDEAHAEKGVNESGKRSDDEECSDRGGDGPELGEEQDEARVKPLTNPGNPSRREIEEHEVVHLPYRSWCDVCVAAKGTER